MVAERAAEHRARFGAYAVSTVTVAEVVRGLQRAQRADHIARFRELCRHVDVLVVDQSVAELGGVICGDLDRSGRTIGLADPLIAATAIVHARALATGNIKHYRRIVELGYDLRLEDWREAGR